VADRSRQVITAVLFDLDGTLYDRDDVVRRVADEQYETFRERFGALDRDQLIARTLELDDHGYARRIDVYRRLLEGTPVDAALAVDLERHFWDCYCRHCRQPEDTVATLVALKSAGKRLGVITNGPIDWQTRKLKTLGLERYFDDIVISDAVGVAKPDARIFALALGRLRSTAAESIYVGDHPDIDIAGALGAGLAAAWKRVPYWTMSRTDVPALDRLSELLDDRHHLLR
jgi:putative hydrolase of the HAD superfamily